LSLAGLLLLPGLAAQSPSPVSKAEPTGFVRKSITVAGTEHAYVVYVPPGYTKERAWPLLLFLHGMGECGTDGERHLGVGLGPAIKQEPERWPFVVVMPQKPDKPSQWFDHEAMVLGAVAATEKEYRIDGKRRMLTGLSQGGAGTWAFGSKHPTMWAAIAPVCGYRTSAFDATALKNTPVWAFHGDADNVVPVAQSKQLCDAVTAVQGNVGLTLYPGVTHNSWDRAYGESNLAEWLRLVGNPDEQRAVRGAGLGGMWRLTVALVDERPKGKGARETLVIQSGEGADDWTVSRSCRRDGAEEAPSPLVRITADVGARELAECMRLLVRGGVYDAPLAAGKRDAYLRERLELEYRADLPGSRPHVHPLFVVTHDPDRKPQIEALRAVMARLRAVR
jgi:predicted esterase